MSSRMMAVAVSVAALSVGVGGAGAATLIVPSGNLSEQVHSNGPQTGLTVTGLSQPGGYFIDFSSASTLNTNGNGVAQIEGPFDFVTISPTAPPSGNQNLVGFSAIQFSVPDHNNDPTGKQINSAGDSFSIVANFLGGGSQTFNPTVVSKNKYEVLAGPGQIISSLEVGGLIDPTAGALQFGDIRQVYFNGAVPEPATWAMMLVGFGGLGMAMRSRRKHAAAAA